MQALCSGCEVDCVAQDKIDKNRCGVIRGEARGGQRVHERKCRVDEGTGMHAKG
jgi:hypothetical protein